MSDFAYPLHEECGVFGIYDRAGTEDVAAAAYSALYALQHRGQESCGIAVNDDGVITGHRDLGLVNEVFTPEVLASLSTTTAHMATGHVRYATAGTLDHRPIAVRTHDHCHFTNHFPKPLFLNCPTRPTNKKGCGTPVPRPLFRVFLSAHFAQGCTMPLIAVNVTPFHATRHQQHH